MMHQLTEIPVIPFAAFLTAAAMGQQQVAQQQIAQQQVAQQIAQACETVGFFYLAQHGLPTLQIDQTFAQAQAFFDLPLSTKIQVLRQPETNCGYVPLLAERLNPERLGDLKEAFNVGPFTPWPLGLASFRRVVEQFYQDCLAQVALPLLRALALALNLPEAFFVERHGQNFFLRLLHYPVLPSQSASNQLGAGEHTDYGTITLLFQNVAGLEICTQQGNWIAAPSQPGTILVNIGDALQRWTNDRFRSTPHRVVLQDARQPRYSMALFCDPNPTVEIACLPTCQSADNPPRYETIRYDDYLQSRFAATY